MPPAFPTIIRGINIRPSFLQFVKRDDAIVNHLSRRLSSDSSEEGTKDKEALEESSERAKHWTEASTAEKHWLDRRLPGADSILW